MPKVLSRGGIYTPSELHRSARRLDRRTARINAALRALRWGELLCLEYRVGKPHWSLSGGGAVAPDIANILTTSPSVTPASHGLFPDAPAQTWKWRHQ